MIKVHYVKRIVFPLFLPAEIDGSWKIILPHAENPSEPEQTSCALLFSYTSNLQVFINPTCLHLGFALYWNCRWLYMMFEIASTSRNQMQWLYTKQEIKDLWHIWSIWSVYLSISFAKIGLKCTYIWGRFSIHLRPILYTFEADLSQSDSCTFEAESVWLAQTHHMTK